MGGTLCTIPGGFDCTIRFVCAGVIYRFIAKNKNRAKSQIKDRLDFSAAYSSWTGTFRFAILKISKKSDGICNNGDQKCRKITKTP